VTDLSLEVEAQDSPIPEPPDNSRIEFTHGMAAYAAWSSSFAAEANGYPAERRWRIYGEAVPETWAWMVKTFGSSLRSLVLLKPYFPPEPLELTEVEKAAAARSEHMSHCHEEACVECMRELRVIRRIVKAIRPHIEGQLAEKHEREVLKEIDERDRCAAWADRLADAIATYTGVDIGEHSNMNDPWGNALEALEPTDYGDSDGAPVAAASIPTPIPDGEER
jgi:hypothetical protein